MQFNNKVSAIVTGGASGLGKATTELIIENGGKIAILDRYELSNDFSIIKENKNNISMNVDVSKEEQIKECFELVYENILEVRSLKSRKSIYLNLVKMSAKLHNINFNSIGL